MTVRRSCRSPRRCSHAASTAATAPHPLPPPRPAAVPVVPWSVLQQAAPPSSPSETSPSDPSDPSALPPSPGAVLLDSLDRDPLLLPPAAVTPSATADAAAAAPPTHASALVEPLVHYRHPNETRRSRIQHLKSVTRQARLEAIRQAQMRPLPDWRVILRRLVEGAMQQDLPLFLLPSSSSSSPSPSSPSEWHRHGVALVLASDSLAVGELLRGTDGSLWALRDRTGCMLKLYRRDVEKDGKDGKDDKDTAADRPWLLTFSGTEPSIRRAVTEVKRMARDAVAVEATVRDDGQTASVASASGTDAADVWTRVLTSNHRDDQKHRDDPVFRPYPLRHSALDIPRPSVWTRDSFERYVAALTNGEIPAHLKTKLYAPARNSTTTTTTTTDPADKTGHRRPKGSPNHERTVVTLLHAVFGDEAARPALSLAALHLALAFVCRHGETYRPDARALFVRAEAVGLPLDTTTFNIMLSSQVKTQDLRNFGTTVLLMRGRGHAPNLDTWLLFLRLFASEEVKRHVLHAMHARGLLDHPAAVHRIAPVMVHHDTERALQALQATTTDAADAADAADADDESPAFLDALLDRLTARYGPGWLARDAAHSILEVLGRHGRFLDCQRLVARLRPPPHGVQPPDTATFNTVLNHCNLHNSLRHAIAITQQMQMQLLITPDPTPVDTSITTTGNSTVFATFSTFVVPPDSVTYQLLFDMAWVRRLPHVLAVLWHYASAARQVSYLFRRRATSVLEGRDSNADLIIDVLRADVLTVAELAAANAAVTAARTAPPTSSPAPAPLPTGLHRIGDLISTRLAQRYDGWEPVVPLGEALHDAMARDNALLRARVLHPDTTPEPMRLPLRRKQPPRDEAAAEIPKTAAEERRRREQEQREMRYMEIRVRPPPPKPGTLSKS